MVNNNSTKNNYTQNYKKPQWKAIAALKITTQKTT